MNPTLAARIYALLLRFYPGRFRAEFELEMKTGVNHRLELQVSVVLSK